MVALTDDDGDIVQRFAYQAYGQSEELNPDYTSYSGTNYSWGYRFTGRELDLETGLQLNRMRYLHLQLGRWVRAIPKSRGWACRSGGGYLGVEAVDELNSCDHVG